MRVVVRQGFYCILQTAHLWANTGVVFRELSFSRLECGVHDRLHIYPLCGVFYFPWHRHQIEGTNGFYCLIRKTERFTISNVTITIMASLRDIWVSMMIWSAQLSGGRPLGRGHVEGGVEARMSMAWLPGCRWARLND